MHIINHTIFLNRTHQKKSQIFLRKFQISMVEVTDQREIKAKSRTKHPKSRRQLLLQIRNK
jgi:hypothetical protein